MNPGVLGILISLGVFFVGAFGFLARRSAVMALMNLEVMLGAGVLALVSAGYLWSGLSAQVMALLVVAVAGAEVAVGLALVALLARHGSREPDLGLLHREEDEQ